VVVRWEFRDDHRFMPDSDTPMPRHSGTMPTAPRRLAATAVDGILLFVVPILWWHWSEWAQYTGTFGRHWPAIVAMPVMALIPLTALWLEAVSGRGAGKGLLGLRVTGASGGHAPLGRRLLRATVKWSPAWVGPAAWIVDLLLRSTHADDFTNDWLLPFVNVLGERLPGDAKQLAWALGVSLRGMNFGALIVPVLVLGELGALERSRRSLLDWMSGTRVMRTPASREGKMSVENCAT
jgi:hypothetical protein